MNIVRLSKFCQKIEELVRVYPEYITILEFNTEKLKKLKQQLNLEKKQILDKIINFLQTNGECYLIHKTDYKTDLIKLYDLNKTCSFKLIRKNYKLNKNKELVLDNKYTIGPGCLDLNNGINNEEGHIELFHIIYEGQIITKEEAKKESEID